MTREDAILWICDRYDIPDEVLDALGGYPTKPKIYDTPFSHVDKEPEEDDNVLSPETIAALCSCGDTFFSLMDLLDDEE